MDSGQSQARLYLLGTFRLEVGDLVLIDASWKRSRAKAIVKLLALQPSHSLVRDQVLEVLWPESNADAAANNLHKNVHYLKTQLGDQIDLITRTRGGAVSLAQGTWVDIDAFRRLAAAARSSRSLADYDAALALYGGDLLPDDVYESWTEEPRRALTALHRALMIEAAGLALRLGHRADAERRFRNARDLDPLDEDVSRELMQLYASSGRRDAALCEYTRLEGALRQELAETPSPELKELSLEIARTTRSAGGIARASALELAGDQCARAFAWDEACADFSNAIALVAGTDNQLECRLRIKLAEVLDWSGESQTAADEYRRVIDIAQADGDDDVLAEALVGFQEASDLPAGNHAGQREAHELIEAALEHLPVRDTIARALLLATSGRPAATRGGTGNQGFITGRLSMSGGRDATIEERLRESVDIARSVGDARTRSYCVWKLRTVIARPETIKERLDLSSELLRTTAEVTSAMVRYRAHMARHEDLMESGDIEGARIQARQVVRLGTETGAANVKGQGSSMLAAHAAADGEFVACERLILEARALSRKVGVTSNSEQRFGMQRFILRWHQGRVGELEDSFVRTVDRTPWMRSSRAMLAVILCENRHASVAEQHYRILTETAIADVPRNFLWWLEMHCLVTLAVALRDRETAADLYEAIVPHAGLNASVANAVSLGSAHFLLGKLTMFLDRAEQAHAHLTTAVTRAISTRQHTWLVYARYQLAQLLIAHPELEGKTPSSEHVRLALAGAADVGMATVAARCRQLLEPQLTRDVAS